MCIIAVREKKKKKNLTQQQKLTSDHLKYCG